MSLGTRSGLCKVALSSHARIDSLPRISRRPSSDVSISLRTHTTRNPVTDQSGATQAPICAPANLPGTEGLHWKWSWPSGDIVSLSRSEARHRAANGMGSFWRCDERDCAKSGVQRRMCEMQRRIRVVTRYTGWHGTPTSGISSSRRASSDSAGIAGGLGDPLGMIRRELVGSRLCYW